MTDKADDKSEKEGKKYDGGPIPKLTAAQKKELESSEKEEDSSK